MYLSLILVVFGLVFYLQFDDPLDNNTQELLALYQPAAEPSEPYLYLLGLLAHPDEDPIQVGRQRFAEYAKQAADADYKAIDYPKAKRLPTPSDDDEFCYPEQSECLARLLAGEIDIAAVLSKHRLLLERVNQLHINNDDSHHIDIAITDVLTPPYGHVIAAARLEVYASLQAYNQGEVQSAIQHLMDNLAMARTQLTYQDTELGKVVYIHLISDYLDTLSILFSLQSGLPALQLSSLTLAEKDLDRVVIRRFYATYSYYKDMMPLLREDFSIPEGQGGWLLRIVFKPNMSINAEAAMHQWTRRLTLLSLPEFAHSLQQHGLPRTSSSMVRNYTGTVLLEISLLPDPTDHIIYRIMDLDAKIRLFNQYYSHGQDVSQLTNPYFPDQPVQVEDGAICFIGPLDNENNKSCLKVGIEPWDSASP